MGHSKQPVPERGMPGPPYREVCANDPLRFIIVLAVVPELDASIEGAGNKRGRFRAVPVNAINFGGVSADGFERFGSSPGIPDVKHAVMGGCQDEGVLAAVFDLGGASKPVAEGEHGLSRPPKIPAKDIAVHSTSCEGVRMVC